MNPRKRLAEIWRTLDDERRLDLIDRCFSAGYLRHSDEGEMSRGEFRDALGALQLGFPDLEARITDTVAEGRRVAYRWVAEGTHEGTFMGAPPTHHRVLATGLTISTFGDDGRIEEDWASWNRSAVLHALGIVPIETEKRSRKESR